MSNRDGYTTIRVSNAVVDKLRKIQTGTDLTLSDIISNSLQHIDGTIIPDTENIVREQVAYDLQYHDKNTSRVRPVTFRECVNSNVGDIFNANTNLTAKEYTNEFAEVIFKDADSCILKLTQVVIEENAENRFSNIIHIALF